MKIAVSAHGKGPGSSFSSRFARCKYFVIFDSQTERWVSLDNPAGNSSGGAGPRAVQFLADQQVEAVISGRYGPQAFQALQAAGIKPFTGREGTPQQLVERWKTGKLDQGTAAASGYH